MTDDVDHSDDVDDPDDPDGLDDEAVVLAVIAHPALCEGLGLCRRWAPSVYHLDDEGYIGLHRLGVPESLVQAARVGASVCPAHAITVVEVAVGAR